MRTRTEVPLAPMTTLRIGGPAARLAEVEHEDDVREAVRDADERGESLFVLGEGSNVVVGDPGFPGLVARMSIRGIDVRPGPGGVIVDVGAGESWDALVARAVDEGWEGVACMSGVPGLVGATPIQNVGAYGQEVSDTITGVRVFDRDVGSFVDMAPRACAFGYRASVFKRASRWIVTRVRFAFARGDRDAVRYAELARTLAVPEGRPAPSRLVRETVLALRRAKGMVLDAGDPDSVSAGSFFVNPVVDAAGVALIEAAAGERPPRFDGGNGRFKVPAAWLVERAGFPRGWGNARAGVSRKHALALVNRGGATSRELLAVARAIHDGVRARFGIVLEPEPVLVGCSWEEDGLQ
jgi:UDP-N-acetylmuramate dehydrogenase